MKNSNKVILCLTLALASYMGIAHAQVSATIYTPAGSLVPYTNFRPEIVTPADYAGLVEYVESRYPNAVVLDNGTSTYNCHAYAWHVSEGGERVWIGVGSTEAEDIYWSDGSYAEVTTGYSKISYASSDHSAIVAESPGYFISKWGDYPLVMHLPGDCPYDASNLKYYRHNLDPHEPNDSPGQASELALDVCTWGYITPANDEDWFMVPIGGIGTLTLSLSNLPADYDLYFLDPYFNILSYADAPGTNPEQIIFSDFTASGYYFVFVVGYQGANDAYTPYSLDIGWSDQPLQPDLVVQDIGIPSSLNAGEESTITFTIVNQGNAAAQPGWDFLLYFDGTGVYSGTITSELPAGAYGSFGLTFPSGFSAGTHVIGMCADSGNVVAEAIEDNNCRSESFFWTETGQPDLIVEDIRTPSSLEAGVDTEVIFVFRNQGTSTVAGGWKCELEINGVVVFNYEVTNDLSPGQGWNLELTFLDGLPAGGHSFEMCADVDSEIAESNENNNCRSETWTWTGGQPDLYVRDILPPASLVALETIDIEFILDNIGTATAWAGYDVAVLVDGSGIGTLEIGSDLPGGASGIVTVAFSGGLSAGYHTLQFEADSNNEVPESDEGNNSREESWTWTGMPDLLAEDIVTPTTLEALASTRIDFVTRNIGNNTAPAGFDVSIQVDGAPVEVVPIENDVVPGGSVIIAMTFSDGLSIGNHPIGMVVDLNDEIGESDTGNNARTEAWEWVGAPDLFIDSISDPSSLLVGDDVSMTIRLLNQGNSPVSTGFEVEIQFDGSRLDGIPINGGMPAFTYMDIYITINGGMPEGVHTLGFLADSQGQIVESDEENNFLLGSWEWEGVSSVPSIPMSFRVYPCSPNPFNPTTVIAYDIPTRSKVKVTIYDLAGHLVRDLKPLSWQEAGHYALQWNGRADHGGMASAGVYLCQIIASKNIETIRMTLVK